MSTPIVDCHTHTSFSDGTSTFEQNVAAAARAGVRVLACPSPWAATRRDQRGRVRLAPL